MKLIPLTQGKFAQVDDEDFEYLNQFKWFAYKHRNTYYARRSVRINGTHLCEQMHRIVMGIGHKKDKIVDHINHNGLDNRKENLRFCTSTQNSQNRTPYINKTSKYKGVSIHRSKRFSKKRQEHYLYIKWQAHIRINKKLYFLGYALTEKDAANLYNSAAIKNYGEFAFLNNTD